MLVSIIIPCNKDRGYLKETVAAAIASNTNLNNNCEILVMEGDKSASANINNGLKIAKGEFVKLCADDDLLTRNCIQDSLEAIQGFDFIHGNAINFWENGAEEIYIPPIQIPTLDDLRASSFIHGGTVLYRKDCFDRFGGFDESLWCAEEYEFNMRLLKNGCKINYCNSILQRYRRHKKQKSLGNTDMVFRSKRLAEINRIQNLFK